MEKKFKIYRDEQLRGVLTLDELGEAKRLQVHQEERNGILDTLWKATTNPDEFLSRLQEHGYNFEEFSQAPVGAK